MSSIAVTASASGAGVITLQAPITATNRTITLPDATGTLLSTATPGVPIGGPAFSAYSTNAQSISSGVTAKIQLNTEVFDTANAFDSTTNYRFTPLVAGYYQINGQIALNGGAAGYARSSLFKNGAGYAEGTSVPNNTVTGAESSVSSIVYLNGSSDYVELYCYLFTGGAALTLQNSSATNYLSGALVRSAT